MSNYLIREIEYQPRITVRPCSAVVDGGGAEPPPHATAATRSAVRANT
jgi:hypothetical protein